MSYNELFIEYNILEPLSQKDLLPYFKKMKSGDKNARELIIEYNIKLVILQVLNCFYNTPYDRKELVAIGLIGLIKSVDTYDISKNIQFSTYASKCIANEINMFLRKEKKYFYNARLDKPIIVGENEKKLCLFDILFDENSDFVSDYENKEINNIIRQIVEKLSFRDKEVISLYFGFIDNKPLSQIEIGERLGLTQSSISRIISKNLKRLERELYELGICESSNCELLEKTPVEKKDINKIPRKLKSIYEFFKDYKKEQIDDVLSKLTEDEKRLIALRYGDDLDNPVISPKWTVEHQEKYYGSLVSKIKRMLSNTKDKTDSKDSNKTEIQQQKTNFGIDKRQEKSTIATEEMKEGPVIDSINNLEDNDIFKTISKLLLHPREEVEEIKPKSDLKFKDDYVKILNFLKNPIFERLMSNLSTKEAVIFALKFGYVDGKYYSTEFIANLLGIEELEVIDLTKKILLVYKDKINDSIDPVVDIAIEESILLKP